ncbi:YbaM family protein [Pseudoalteromonas sp. Hal040]|uniref:YbaM family protein n=1 Tax=Pseudoalteromonas sp. Hal040 TaxID=3035157 RepID=UPI00301D9E2E
MSNELDSAPNYIKIAVDLIMLLEQNDVPAEDVLAALEIVKSDFEMKLPNQLINSPKMASIGA